MSRSPIPRKIPTFLVRRSSRAEAVTVASFRRTGGLTSCSAAAYARYVLAARLLGNRLSACLMHCEGCGTYYFHTAAPNLGKFYRLAAPFIPKTRRWPAPGDKLHKGAALLDAGSGMGLYRGLVSHWEPDGVVLGATEPKTLLSGAAAGLPSLTEQM